MGSTGLIMTNLAMILSGAGGALVLGGKAGSPAERAGRKLLLGAAAAGMVSLLALVYLLLNHDYRIAYVHEYANRNMALGYLVTAVWGGQAGSLLLWAVIQTGYTAALVLFGRKATPFALGFLALLQTCFLALVLFHSNPFETLGTAPMSGIGLNPLLLNPYMSVHPPSLFLGFVGFSVPFALSLGALVEGRPVDEWVAEGRPWILFAWMFLSIGNLLGMLWAYQELGWGGYWGWDPVENASFMPWLTGTALVHTSLIQRQRGLYRMLNPALAMLTFTLVVFGTFITRSGVIQSVHAFAGATVGPYLLGLIIFMLLVGTGMIYRNRRTMEPPKKIAVGFFTRENLFQFMAWVLLASTAFVWLGTMAPLFTELLKGEKVASTPELFNRWMVPLGLLLLATLGVCLSIHDRRRRDGNDSSPIKGLSMPAGAAGIAAVIGSAALGIRGVWPVVSLGLVGAVALLSIREAARLVKKISRDDAGLTIPRQRRLAAHVVHVSVVLLFVGFTGSAFTEEKSGVLNPGEAMQINGFTVRLKGVRDDYDYRRHAVLADLEVFRGGSHLGIFSVARDLYHSHPKQPTSEVAIRTGLCEDLFLILGRVDTTSGAALIRAVVNPLVLWVWLGGTLLVAGTLLGMLPKLRLGVTWSAFTEPARHPAMKGLAAGLALSALFVGTALSDSLLTSVAVAVGAGVLGTIWIMGSALFTLTQDQGLE